MTDKAKRKCTPRRRFGIRWLLLIITLVSGGITTYYLLQPESERIIYTVNNDDGSNTVYLTDINNLQRTEELFSIEGRIISSIVTDSGIFMKIDLNIFTPEYYFYDFHTGNMQEIVLCDTCSNLDKISPNGAWLPYFTNGTGDTAPSFADFMLYHIPTQDHILVAQIRANEFTSLFTIHSHHMWIEDGTTLIFAREVDDGQIIYATFDIETLAIANENIVTVNLTDRFFNALSSNGEYYSISDPTIRVPNNHRVIIQSLYNNSIVYAPPAPSSDTHYLDFYKIWDWHPQEDMVLVQEVWRDLNTDFVRWEVYLHNIASGEVIAIDQENP
ncbi:MAG: hypothetical protein AAF846_17130 [Chloroflexota bacterium]